MTESSSMQNAHPDVQAFFDARTSSVQYVVSDPATRACAIIDPVLDYDEKSGSVATHSADAIMSYVERHDLRVAWILDTHPHADHLTAARVLQDRTGAPTAIGADVTKVQALWTAIYGLPTRSRRTSCGTGSSSRATRSVSAASRAACWFPPAIRRRRSAT